MHKPFGLIALLIVIFISASSCHKPGKDNSSNPPVSPPDSITASTAVKGYGLLSRISGIWDGPVTSTTALGGYPEWIVDFRPISGGQVSAKNELDTMNDIFMSFFIVYDSSEYKLCFRNGGSFAGMKRVSYLITDSVSETGTQAYYRFSDFVKGTRRAWSEVIFHDDSMILRSYTNKNNSLSSAVLHMEWRAGRQDTSSCQAARQAFGYPRKEMVKNFSSTFAGLTESIFYTLNGDPYPESAQPYLGQSTLSFSFSSVLPAPDPNKSVLMFVTTQPMISGFSINYASLKTRSRYVILASGDRSYTFTYMHPGTYYVYAIYDADGNHTMSSGDYVSATNTTFTLPATGTASQTTQINYQVP
ncbi:MAG: hypothetical protein JST83_08480 [Bacteroidetes bacterium]|nr:hypothetical protein [Bacteroidota bacterium]